MNNTNYLDELVLYEYGKYDITKYKEWVTEWDKWLYEERTYVKEVTEENGANEVKYNQVQMENSINE